MSNAGDGIPSHDEQAGGLSFEQWRTASRIVLQNKTPKPLSSHGTPVEHPARLARREPFPLSKASEACQSRRLPRREAEAVRFRTG